MKPKRLVIATGGTGGHLFPAMSLAEELKGKCDVVLAGNRLEASSHLDSFKTKDISAGRKVWPLLKGFFQSLVFLRKFSPDVVVGFGSFYTFPQILAAKCLKIPVVIHEANVHPGRMNRFVSPYVKVIALQFQEAEEKLKGTCIEVGLPLRKGFKKGTIDLDEAYDYFGLSQERPVVLVLGGSQGAAAINRAVEDLKMQMIHLTGDGEEKRVHGEICRVPFEKRMDFAWAIADVSISRAGGSTMAEQIEFEVPSIHIPYLKSMENHQLVNAKYFEEVVKGGVCLEEKDLSAESLVATLQKLLSEKVSYKQAIRKFKNSRIRISFAKLIGESI